MRFLNSDLIAVPDVLTSLPFLKFIGLLAEDSGLLNF
jgi:hypothetical protein